MKRLSDIEYRRMAEFAVRATEVEKKAIEGAKKGAQPPTRAQRSRSGRPGPDDIISGTPDDF